MLRHSLVSRSTMSARVGFIVHNYNHPHSNLSVVSQQRCAVQPSRPSAVLLVEFVRVEPIISSEVSFEWVSIGGRRLRFFCGLRAGTAPTNPPNFGCDSLPSCEGLLQLVTDPGGAAYATKKRGLENSREPHRGAGEEDS